MPTKAFAEVYRSAPAGTAYWMHPVDSFPCNEIHAKFDPGSWAAVEPNGIFTVCASAERVRI